MCGALLGAHLREVGLAAVVHTGGTLGDGEPALDRATYLLSERGLDVSDHRSRGVDEGVVTTSDLILTAERTHVAFIAGRWPDTFARTFTLPEIVQRAEQAGPRQGGSLPSWLAALGEGRPTAFDYLDADDIAEVADPTGGSPRAWDAAFAEIDDLTARLARLLA